MISWMSTTGLIPLYYAMANNGLAMKQMICWVKNRFTLGRTDFQYQHEPAIYSISEGKFNKEDKGCTDGDCDVAIYSRSGGKWSGSRSLSTCWFFDSPVKSPDHPTMKPIALCAKGVLALAGTGEIVFDPFLGSGSTLIAAEQTDRICYGCELDPKYCDVIRKRYWKCKTGSEDGWQKGTKCL